MYNKTIIEFGFRMMSWIIKTSCLYYLPKPKTEADNRDLGFDNSWYHAQPHPISVCLLPYKTPLFTLPVKGLIASGVSRLYNNNYLPFDFEDKSYIVWCDYSSESFL